MVFSFIKGIVVYVLLAGVASYMAPKDSYSKYINFFCGVVLVYMLLEPVSFLLKNVDTLSLDIDREIDEIASRYSGLYDISYQKDSIEEAVKQTIVSECNVSYEQIKDVEVFSYDEADKDSALLASCKIYITGELDEENIICTISYFYNISKSNIYILRW